MATTAPQAATLRAADLTAAIVDDRRQLAAFLAELEPDSWDVPSLCEGWRVRELVAHITMPFRFSTAKFMIEMAKAGGNFNRMADRAAKRDAAAMSTDQLLAALRDNLNHPWQPSGGGLESALTHDVIHGLDFTVPLNLDWPIPEERIRTVLQTVTSPRSLRHFGADLRNVQLLAVDIDWSFGSGVPVMGGAQDLLLLVCGRTLPPGRLQGRASERFTRRSS
jgi:uncharacterized protein (TIGR03083 family)